ncbi:nicotinate-nucleotide--dimethylbenzimidazole phosphoribosyltransferase [Paludisphaera sp.]|uniref:nicotinate-nucleotide--dimethylbenzimidazole phosphoribosyltransferase n=1 Tax=Paludisphaera sp. TaxID=2017432 RepID=UPI00301C2E7F
MSLLVIGCGYLGERVAREHARRGEPVFALTRSAARAGEFEAIGLRPVIGDVLDDSLRLPAVDRVLHAVGYDRTAAPSKRSVYVDGLANILGRLPSSVGRLVYVGSTSVYGDRDGGWVDEETPTEPITEAGRICLEAERVLAAWAGRSGVSTVVVRCAGLYGPGRIIRRDLIAKGEPIPGDPDRHLSLIHIDDAGRAATAALDAASPGPLYLAADDRPVRRREYYRVVAAALGAPSPSFAPPAPGSSEAARDTVDRRIRNRRLKAELGLALRYPTIETGVPAALGRPAPREQAAWDRLDGLAKPPGSLGRLETLAARLCGIQGTLSPRTKPRRLVVFAADHGVVAEGVTAWPSDVTGAMIRSIARGGAACSAIASACDADVTLVDVGSMSVPLPSRPGYEARKVAEGTRNLAVGPAMSADEFDRATAIGAEHARRAFEDGMAVVAAGDLGIGNTTAASCLAVLLADVPPPLAVGRGAGADDATLARKLRVVESATARARPSLDREPIAAIAEVCGFEIAAMAGFYMEASRLGLTIVLDGAIATAAALIAETLRRGTVDSMIAAHLSDEPAHAPMLARLGLEPLLGDWRLRLGEGTGALLAFPLLDAAAAIVTRMDSLEAALAEPDHDGP